MGALVSRAAAAMLGDASDEAELRRWMDEEDARRQAIQEKEEEEDYLCIRLLPSEEVRDGYSIWKARAALHHYNANHPGAEYDLVKPLMAACVIFRGNMWHHVSFLAHMRDQLVSPPVEYFFAELRDGCSDDDSIVEACPMIENPQICMKALLYITPSDNGNH